MAYMAVRTDKGTRKEANEDACCVEVAMTAFGEMAMAIVCDGVGGLSRGNVASATVVDRFADWFERELPILMEGMAQQGKLDMGTIKAVWGALLQQLNEMIQAYGTKTGESLGTTFTGLVACAGQYLVAHVGDCRAYRMSANGFEQLTEDQTLVARQLAMGEISEQEAATRPHNVILQSVGTERVLAPACYEGSFSADDLFVLCCDGAYNRASNDGLRQLFQPLDYRDERALDAACVDLLRRDMEHGEKDNLTVVCLSGALADADGTVAAPQARATAYASVTGGTWPADDAWEDADEGDAPLTAVWDDEDVRDDVPSAVELAPDDLPTAVECVPNELPTSVEDVEGELPTVVESEPVAYADDDDLPTQVEGDEDELPTMVEGRDA